MPISIEEAQKLTDLRQRMLRNIAAGKPSFEGITEQELSEGLSFLRQNRLKSAEAKEKVKSAGASKGRTKKAASAVQVDTTAFTDLDLD